MLKRFVTLINENKSWILLSVVFFVAGYGLAVAAVKQDPELLKTLEETSLSVLRDLGEQVFSGPRLQGAGILFVHNLTSSVQIIILGIFLGIPALAAAIANGAVLGILAFQLGQQGIAPLPYLTAGILPHGVFELPAFFLSTALGLKLGYHVVFPYPGQSRKDTLRGIFQEIGAALPYIFVLLAVAALVEVFVTPGMIGLFTSL